MLTMLLVLNAGPWSFVITPQVLLLNPLYTGRLFLCNMSDESIHRFRGVGSIWSLLFYFFLWKILLANSEDLDQTPHYVASDLGLHCLPMTLFRDFQVRMLANSEDLDQTPHYVASDLGLHCLPMTLFRDFQVRMG